MSKCIECDERKIEVTKRSMCRRCYQRFINSGGLVKKVFDSEAEFIKNHFTHKNWIYEPVRFKLNGTTYTPDFYDQEKNVFIEVVGTKQAFHRNKEKYKEFKKIYPGINFEIRESNGKIIDITKPKPPTQEEMRKNESIEKGIKRMKKEEYLRNM